MPTDRVYSTLFLAIILYTTIIPQLIEKGVVKEVFSILLCFFILKSSALIFWGR